METLLWGVSYGSWTGDIDITKMFLNFCLDDTLHQHCGVDFCPYFDSTSDRAHTQWEHWVRCMMGLKVSLCLTIKALLLGLEWILGITKDPTNVFYWTRVQLNLPGESNYDPLLPWVSWVKPCGSKEVLAALLVIYVDDLRTVGLSEENCWVIMHHISSGLGHLGVQIAAQKILPPKSQP